jgi:LPS export ABC transporter protein LptC
MKIYNVLFLSSILFFACGNKEIKTFKKYEGPMLIGENIFTNYTDSGKVKLRMWAPEQQELESGDRIFPKGIKIDFFEKEVVSSTLTANYATFSKASGIYTVRNNVVIQSKDQQKKLNTEELKWLPKKHRVRIENDKFVRIQTKTEVLTGMGLDATEDFRSYKIKKPQGVFATNQP